MSCERPSKTKKPSIAGRLRGLAASSQPRGD
jgi:hypothetical protein